MSKSVYIGQCDRFRQTAVGEETWQRMMKHKAEISEEEFLSKIDPSDILDDDETWDQWVDEQRRQDDDFAFYKSIDDLYFVQVAGFEFIWKHNKTNENKKTMIRIKLFEEFLNENSEHSAIQKRIEELSDKIDDVRSAFDKEWFSKENLKKMDSFSAEAGYNKYLKERDKTIQKEVQELDALQDKLRMEKEPKLEDIPEYGDVMTLADFISNVKSGGFIDYDGSGNYVKGDKMTDISIYPSDVKKGNIRKEFDKIVWFNR